jgi:hypothetical protein
MVEDTNRLYVYAFPLYDYSYTYGWTLCEAHVSYEQYGEQPQPDD